MVVAMVVAMAAAAKVAAREEAARVAAVFVTDGNRDAHHHTHCALRTCDLQGICNTTRVERVFANTVRCGQLMAGHSGRECGGLDIKQREGRARWVGSPTRKMQAHGSTRCVSFRSYCSLTFGVSAQNSAQNYTLAAHAPSVGDVD